jgi:hypothetical protein
MKTYAASDRAGIGKGFSNIMRGKTGKTTGQINNVGNLNCRVRWGGGGR